MVEMLGYSEEEMMGKHLFSFMDEEGVEIAKMNLERREQGIAEQHDFEFLKKDGERIYTSIETSPILDDSGNYNGAMAAVADITARKLAEDGLRSSEEQFRLVVDKSPIPMVITDVEGNIEHFNVKFIKRFGWTIDDVKTSDEWWNVAYPDEEYRKLVQKSWTDAAEKAEVTGKEIEPQEWKLT
jgi:PAS domain S-box-containing protein